MFEKLLSNLPFNPDLVNQVAFYARRMRQEESIRRTGMIFVVLAFLVQFIAFTAPAPSTAAYSNSDMINGGISSKADAVNACRNNIKNYGDALWNFHITCGNIVNATTTTILSNSHGGNLYSLSWLPYGATNPTSGKATHEQALNLAKVSQTLYARLLTSADHLYPVSQYTVLQGTSQTGQTFWIMYGCGNLMFVGVPTPAPVCHANGTVYYAGAQECQPPVCQYNSAIPASDARCVQNCPYDSTILITDARCSVCPYNSSILKSSPQCIQPCKYDSSISATDARCQACPYDASISASAANCIKPCPYNSSLPSDSPQCKPCDASQGSADAQACIVEHKTATNVTQNLADANNTTAQPGDTITYTLYAQNTGKADVPNFVMEENLSDVLVYADAVDLHGGSQDSNGLITWPATTIKAGDTLSNQITVQVKKTLPAGTPTPDDPNHFDLILTNVYGNAVNIKLPQSPAAVPVAATKALPNTGPGAGLIIGFMVVMIAGYFLARSRLLVDESIVAIQESNGGTL